MNPPVVDELPVWQRIRRYAVPAPMIEACAAARAAGDWRAACAAGRVDVAFDLAEVAREHGRVAAARIEADLVAFAPDLLRWHLPRTLGGRTSLATHQDYLLSTQEGALTADDIALVLHMPKVVDGSQRLRFTVRPVLAELSEQRDLPPVYWSSAHAGGLAPAYGGSTDRLPGFEPDGRVRPFGAYPTAADPADPASRVEAFDRHVAAGDIAAAWAAAGIDLDPKRPETYHPERALDAAIRGNLVPVGLAAELARLHTRYGVTRAMLGERHRLIVDVRRHDDGALTASFLGYDPARFDEHFHQPRLATPVHARPADLDLLRHGLLDRDELHPLVREALFPVAPARSAPRDDRPEPRISVPVRCHGEWHRVVHGDGRLDLPAHSAREVAREQSLGALGGRVSGCVAALGAWHGSGGRLPRPLRDLRRDALLRIQHGGSAPFAELLDAGLDPRMGDGRGGTLLHHLRCTRDVTLVRRLVDAGVPLDAGDRRGRTALHVAVGDGATPEMVQALLDAGADPQAPDRDGYTVVDLANDKASMYIEDGDEDEVAEEHRPVLRVRDVVTAWLRR